MFLTATAPAAGLPRSTSNQHRSGICCSFWGGICFRPHVRLRVCFPFGSVLKPNIVQHVPKRPTKDPQMFRKTSQDFPKTSAKHCKNIAKTIQVFQGSYTIFLIANCFPNDVLLRLNLAMRNFFAALLCYRDLIYSWHHCRIPFRQPWR